MSTKAKTTFRVGDPEPAAKDITLKACTGATWYRYLGGWRNGLMAPHAVIAWTTLLGHHGPLREIRLVGREWMFTDEIPQPTLGVIGAKAAREAGWVPLAEVLAALRDRSGLADWLEGKGRFVWPDGPTLDIAGTYLADRFGAKEGTDGSVPA